VADRDGQVVVVPDVDVNAAQHSGFGPNGVPLHRLDPAAPLRAEELGEAAALVPVGLERA
jgi:hypothetical protein